MGFVDLSMPLVSLNDSQLIIYDMSIKEIYHIDQINQRNWTADEGAGRPGPPLAAGVDPEDPRDPRLAPRTQDPLRPRTHRQHPFPSFALADGPLLAL